MATLMCAGLLFKPASVRLGDAARGPPGEDGELGEVSGRTRSWGTVGGSGVAGRGTEREGPVAGVVPRHTAR
ncbi:hypothetical protein GCM10027294_01630 [Marinactinospora endophytica]